MIISNNKTGYLYKICSAGADQPSPLSQVGLNVSLKLGTVDDEFVQLESRLTALFGPINSVYRQTWDRGKLKNFLADDSVSYTHLTLPTKA